MSSPDSPDAAAARRMVATATVTRSSMAELVEAVGAEGFAAPAVTRLAVDVVTGLRAAFLAGTRGAFGTGRGRWTLVALTSTALSTGLGATSSPEASVNNGVRRRFARSPEALAAPAASMSAPDPRAEPLPAPALWRMGTTLGSAISRSSPKSVSPREPWLPSPPARRRPQRWRLRAVLFRHGR